MTNQEAFMQMFTDRLAPLIEQEKALAAQIEAMKSKRQALQNASNATHELKSKAINMKPSDDFTKLTEQLTRCLTGL